MRRIHQYHSYNDSMVIYGINDMDSDITQL